MKKYLSFLGAIMLVSSTCATSVISFTSHSTLQTADHEQIIELSDNLDEIEESLNNNESNEGIDWSFVREVLNIDVSDSNNDKIWKEFYRATNIKKPWDWGLKIHFEEGVVNVIRIFKMISDISGYYGENWSQPLEDYIEIIWDFYDYLLKVPTDYRNDLVSTFKAKTEEFKKVLLDSKLPFTDFVLDPLDIILEVLETFTDEATVDLTVNAIGLELQKKYGTTFIQFCELTFDNCDKLTDYLNQAKQVTKRILKVIPIEVLRKITIPYLIDGIINNDTNRKGVYFKIQNYTIPLGFFSK